MVSLQYELKLSSIPGAMGTHSTVQGLRCSWTQKPCMKGHLWEVWPSSGTWVTVKGQLPADVWVMEGVEGERD